MLLRLVQSVSALDLNFKRAVGVRSSRDAGKKVESENLNVTIRAIN